MTSPIALTRAQQRASLQLQLHVQRQLIARRLGPVDVVVTDYPRSMTMRLLTQHGPMALSLLAGGGAARLLKIASAALVVGRIVRSISGRR